MLGKTHSIFGAVCALGVLVATKQSDPVTAGICIACASVGALTPDLDHPQATLSQKNIIFGAASRVMSGVSSHRRFWHTIPACLLFSAFFFAVMVLVGGAVSSMLEPKIEIPSLMPYYINAAIYFFIGALSHLIADALNPQGAPLLWPLQKNLNKKVHVPVICVETGSPGEMIYRALFTAMGFVLAWIYMTSMLGIDLVKLIFIW